MRNGTQPTLRQPIRLNVSVGSNSDLGPHSREVGSPPDSGHAATMAAGPLGANTGLDILAEHGRCSPAGDIALLCSNPMNPRMICWRPRWPPILVVVALVAFAIVAVRSLREPVLRAAGWALVIN